MKTALDNYERGKQKESNADDYSRFIDYPKGRFICPECGEPVHLRPSKLNVNFFVHYKRTDENVDCDRRVDGIQVESIYEKLGLPLYIRLNEYGTFDIYVGFKAIPEALLSKLEKENVSVYINGDIKNSFRVNRERFSSDYSVMIPLNHIPSWENNYIISFKNASRSSLEAIKKHWSDYAEGFLGSAGALFSISNNGGRKIRHGDNVVTDTEYYWVTKSFYSLRKPYIGITSEKIGKLSGDKDEWLVYKVIFNSDISDNNYNILSDFLREKLRVHLIEKSSEFVPVWPPLVKGVDGYAFNSDKSRKIIGVVKSGNESPRVYAYRGISTKAEDLVVNDGIAEISISNCSFVVNVDRKYSSSGTYFNPNRQEYTVVRDEVIFKTENDIAFISNLDGYEAIIYRKNGEIVKRKDSNNCTFEELKKGDVIKVFSDAYLLFSKYINIEEKLVECQKSTDVKKLIQLTRNYNNSFQVYVPYEIMVKLHDLEKEYPEFSCEIDKILRKNKIALPMLKILEGEI